MLIRALNSHYDCFDDLFLETRQLIIELVSVQVIEGFIIEYSLLGELISDLITSSLRFGVTELIELLADSLQIDEYEHKTLDDVITLEMFLLFGNLLLSQIVLEGTEVQVTTQLQELQNYFH